MTSAMFSCLARTVSRLGPQRSSHSLHSSLSSTVRPAHLSTSLRLLNLADMYKRLRDDASRHGEPPTGFDYRDYGESLDVYTMADGVDRPASAVVAS